MYIAFNAYLGEQESFFQKEHEIAQREQQQYADHTVLGNHTIQERYSSIAAAAWDKICLIRDVRKKFQDMWGERKIDADNTAEPLQDMIQDVLDTIAHNVPEDKKIVVGEQVIVLPERGIPSHGIQPYAIVTVFAVEGVDLACRTNEGKEVLLYLDEVQKLPTTEPLDQE